MTTDNPLSLLDALRARLITPEQAIGKTVAQVGQCYEEIVFLYTDGSFCLIVGYHDGALTLVLTPSVITLSHLDILVDVGVIHESDADLLREAVAAAARATTEQRERAELARLQAKYGPDGPRPPAAARPEGE